MNIIEDDKKELGKGGRVTDTRERERLAAKEAVLKSLPAKEEDAITAQDIQGHLPDRRLRSIIATLAALFGDGTCNRKESHFGLGVYRYIYWRNQRRFLFTDLGDIILKCIKERLPRTKEKAITSEEFYNLINRQHKFQAVLSGLSYYHKQGEIRREGKRPYYYWIEPTGRELEEQTMAEAKPTIVTPPSIDVTLMATPYSEGRVILARIKAVEADIANIYSRYEKVESALKERKLSDRLKKAEMLKAEEKRKLEAIEEELKRWNEEEANVTEGILR